MGNKDKVTAATESQKKRVFSEHLYFSHPRLEAQTAAAFLQRERGRCCCDQGCFRDHSGRPHLLSAPQLSRRCPAPASVLGVTLSPRGASESLETLSKAQLCQENLSFFSQGPWLKVLQNARFGNGFLLPGPQRHPLLSKSTESCSVPAGTPLPCTLHTDWGSWPRPGWLPTSTAFVFHTTSGRNMMGCLLRTPYIPLECCLGKWGRFL